MRQFGDRATIDTNIAIYAFDDSTAKAAVARQALDASDFLSVQLLNEFANVIVRKRGRSWEDASWGVDLLAASVDTILPVDHGHNRTGLRLAARYGLSFYDALMLAVALAGGARTIYSEDMQHDLLVDGTLRIVDPFR